MTNKLHQAHFNRLFLMRSTSICKLIRILFSSSREVASCFISCLCCALSCSTDARRSRSWVLSSSTVVGVRGECRSSGEGLRPEEEGDTGRCAALGVFRDEALAGRGALLSATETAGTVFLKEPESSSSLPLSLSFLSSAAFDSRNSAEDKDDGAMICDLGRLSVTRGRDTVG